MKRAETRIFLSTPTTHGEELSYIQELSVGITAEQIAHIEEIFGKSDPSDEREPLCVRKAVLY